MSHTTRTAIVTGGSKGIGKAIALPLARDGCAVVVNYSGDPAAATQVVDAIQDHGGQGIAVKTDVADPQSISTLFDTAERTFGPVDVLVNNAGVMRLGPIGTVSDDDFSAHMAINIGGVFRGLREASDRLRTGGAIVSLSSSVVGLYQLDQPHLSGPIWLLVHDLPLVHLDDGFMRWRAVARGTVGAFFVVVFSPFYDQDLSFPQAVEDFSIQELIPESGIEAFTIAVLPG